LKRINTTRGEKRELTSMGEGKRTRNLGPFVHFQEGGRTSLWSPRGGGSVKAVRKEKKKGRAWGSAGEILLLLLKERVIGQGGDAGRGKTICKFGRIQSPLSGLRGKGNTLKEKKKKRLEKKAPPLPRGCSPKERRCEETRYFHKRGLKKRPRKDLCPCPNERELGKSEALGMKKGAQTLPGEKDLAGHKHRRSPP